MKCIHFIGIRFLREYQELLQNYCLTVMYCDSLTVYV